MVVVVVVVRQWNDNGSGGNGIVVVVVIVLTKWHDGGDGGIVMVATAVAKMVREAMVVVTVVTLWW